MQWEVHVRRSVIRFGKRSGENRDAQGGGKEQASVQRGVYVASNDFVEIADTSTSFLLDPNSNT